MKKLLTILCLALTAALLFTACAEKEPKLVGGWQNAEDQTVTAELQEIFDNAAASYEGLDLTPKAYLAHQVVAGTNHLFQCVDSANNEYKVTVYQDLQGGFTITKVEDKDGNDVTSAILPEIGAPAGAPEEPQSGEITAELQEVFDKAMEGYDGAKLEPVELLSTQVVAGVNYRFLCNETILVPGAEPKEVIVTIYQDLEGNCSITDVEDKEENDSPAGAPIEPESTEITAELQEKFDKAMEGYDGAKLEPVELLSTQVVAGVNYRFLCNETILVPGAEPKEVIVTVFEDLEGNCSITDIADKE